MRIYTDADADAPPTPRPFIRLLLNLHRAHLFLEATPRDGVLLPLPLPAREASLLLPRRGPLALEDAPDGLGADAEPVGEDGCAERGGVDPVQESETVHGLARELAGRGPPRGELFAEAGAVGGV